MRNDDMHTAVQTPESSRSISQLRGPINGLIADRMRQLGHQTVREFADYAGIGRTSLHDLLRGRTTAGGAWMKPSWDTLTKLATALRHPAHELIYLIDPEVYGSDVPMASDVVQVPVAVAGKLEDSAGTRYERMKIVVESEFAWGRDLIAFLLTDDSMAGGRHPVYAGDVVVVDRNTPGEPSSVVVARLMDGTYVCRRFHPNNMLGASNPDYAHPELSLLPMQRVDEILGRVVRVIHNAT